MLIHITWKALLMSFYRIKIFIENENGMFLPFLTILHCLCIKMLRRKRVCVI